jgi:hypothetical protein
MVSLPPTSNEDAPVATHRSACDEHRFETSKIAIRAASARSPRRPLAGTRRRHGSDHISPEAKPAGLQGAPIAAADKIPAMLARELALWRAFLGDEIDAILRDKD